MSIDVSDKIPVSRKGEPAWALATLFPPQGMWNDGDYLALNTNRLIELDRGHLEVLPMPSELHQLIVAFLYRALFEWSQSQRKGTVLMAPMKVRMADGRFREPDVLFMRHEHAHRRHPKFWDSADLVMEVVSEDDPDRDLVTKRREYAEAGIPEYWIVDPRDQTIRVLVLESTDYVEVAVCRSGELAASRELSGFIVQTSLAFMHD